MTCHGTSKYAAICTCQQTSCNGYIKRNMRFILGTAVTRTLFSGLVRPHLGYATQIWAPQSIKLTSKLERIQRRATRFILNLPYSSTISYNSCLQTLNLLPICYWHELLDLVFFFKITHGLVNVDSSVLPDVRKYRRTRSTTTNIKKYIPKKCKTTTYQKSFLVRACRIWNCLADELDYSLVTLTLFKSVLFNYYKTSWVTSFDCEDPRTFKTVCLKCNSVRPLSRPILCCNCS